MPERRSPPLPPAALRAISRIPPLRSLRWRALLVVIVVVLLPLVIVATASDPPLYELRFQLARLTLVMLPVGLLLGAWLGWRMVVPIERLRAQVTARARGQPHGIALDRHDEMGDLAAAFSALVTALEDQARAHEVFVTDLVHELKSPVATIRASADSLERGAADEARASRIAAVLKETSARMDALVTQLLELAKAEGGLPDEPRIDVDLAPLARGIVDSMRADERHTGVILVVDAPRAAVVRGAPGQLETLIRNLLDNAASFAGAGGSATVTLDVDAAGVTLSVADSGPGISPEDLPRVFDRFFTTRGEQRGTGLGLALARAIAQAHGGSLDATSPPSSGAVFRTRFPR